MNYPRNSNVNEPIMYGDHDFMEALIKPRYPIIGMRSGVNRAGANGVGLLRSIKLTWKD
ncbi:MAG: hypothetical protein HN403_16460 [Rhodospirillales bacterium]|nr:hypothetical protein [Rhodospirillales bacterium]